MSTLNTCPVCKRVWVITPADDCLVPRCGCYGDGAFAPWSGNAPCERDGLRHAMTCPKMKEESSGTSTK